LTTDRQDPADPRFAVWIGATAALFLIAIAVGFVLLPSAQQGAGDLDLWSAICRAVGLPVGGGRNSTPVLASQPASAVAWTTTIRRLLMQGSAARGAALATTCNNCHGTGGVSSDAAIPNLGGQSVAAIYKQLEDFKDGRRNAAVMGVFVEPLSQQDMIDLATYYASIPDQLTGTRIAAGSSYSIARRLVEYGNPMRNIASCAGCHGPMGFTPGAPGLEGQQRAYLEQQLQALKAGARHNDIGEQMRSVARQLTQDEIAALAAYYASLADRAAHR